MIRDKLLAQRAVESNGFRWRSGDVTRLEQFSDAVFGFALALLVVSGDVPRTGDQLFATLRDFPAFGATFATLVWIWFYHYQYFRRFGFVDAASVALNSVLLFLILFFVYPLKFLFSSLFAGMFTGVWSFGPSQSRIIMTLYALGFVAVFGMFVLLYRHALRYATQLELNDVELMVTKASLRSNQLLVGVGVFSALLTWLGPSWIAPFAGMAFGFIGPVMWWHWSRFHKRLEAVKAAG